MNSNPLSAPDIFKGHIRNLARLRELVPEPTANITFDKIQLTFDKHCETLINASPYVVMATTNKVGRCDCSPRGGPPGFIKILNSTCLLIPELSGNRRADTLSNLLENPFIGLVFLIPGFKDILRVNGSGFLIDDPDVLQKASVAGKLPIVGIGVEMHEAYMHCSKAALRSSIWDSEGWPDLSKISSMAEILRDHTQGTVGDGSIEAIQAFLDESYKNRLFEPGW